MTEMEQQESNNNTPPTTTATSAPSTDNPASSSSTEPTNNDDGGYCKKIFSKICLLDGCGHKWALHALAGLVVGLGVVILLKNRADHHRCH